MTEHRLTATKAMEQISKVCKEEDCGTYETKKYPPDLLNKAGFLESSIRIDAGQYLKQRIEEFKVTISKLLTKLINLLILCVYSKGFQDCLIFIAPMEDQLGERDGDYKHSKSKTEFCNTVNKTWYNYDMLCNQEIKLQ